MTAFLGAWAVTPAVAAPKLDSRWLDSKLNIDGFVADWHGEVTRFKKSKLDLGVANDDKFLYLSISGEERAVRRQIMMQGLTVWLDASSEQQQVFGLRFPLGMRPPGREDGPRPTRSTAVVDPRSAEGEAQRQRREAFRQRAEESMSYLEILGAGNEVVERLAVDEIQGLEIAVNAEQASEKFGYELKIPLQASAEQPWAIGNVDGGTLGIGLVSPKFERPERSGERAGRGNSRGGSFGAGRGGSGGGAFGGPGRQGGRGGFGQRGGRAGRGERRGDLELSAIDLWTTYTLAVADQAREE